MKTHFKKTFHLSFSIFSFITVFFLSAQLSAQTGKMKEVKGFKNYVFGTAPDAYKNLTLEIEEGSTKLYSHNGPLTIDGVELEYLRITFTKNKLSDISIQSKNSTGTQLLKNLKDSYGEPSRMSKSKKSYEWFNEKLQLLYETNMAGNDATVSFSSKKTV